MMKINGSNHVGAVNPYKKNQELYQSEAAGKKKKKDELVISSEAKALHGSQSTDRIEKLKSAVASGTYYVDAGKIAEKLLPFLK